MAGETWRELLQVGRESVFGTPVACPRAVYVMEPEFNRTRDPRPKRFPTGGRDNQRAQTLGPVAVDGKVSLDVSPSESLEWLECMLGAATVVPAVGGTLAMVHTYVPKTTIPSMTVERNDGAQLLRATGVMVDALSLSGSVMAENKLDFTLFAAEYLPWVGPPTTRSAERVPGFLDGWQAFGYLDDMSGVAGTTKLVGSLINWTVDAKNNLGRKYFASNSLALGALTTGELDITAGVMLEASAAVTPAEVAKWEAQTNRVLRLEFLGPANGIETGQREFMTFDIPGAWATVNYNANDAGTRTYEFSLNYLYSSALGAGLVVRCCTPRTAAFV